MGSFSPSDHGLSLIHIWPLSPKKLQHLYLPEKKLIIVTAETPIHVKYDKVFDINGIMDVDGIRTHISEIERNLHLYGMLINNALDKLSETKKLHDILEVIYSNSVSYTHLDVYKRQHQLSGTSLLLNQYSCLCLLYTSYELRGTRF